MKEIYSFLNKLFTKIQSNIQVLVLVSILHTNITHTCKYSINISFYEPHKKFSEFSVNNVMVISNFGFPMHWASLNGHSFVENNSTEKIMDFLE